MKEIALLLVISGWSQTVWAQLNFYPESIDADIEIGYGLAIGDVDGDGHQDIILADKKAFVWYHNPDWKKHTIIEDLTERDNVCLAARDIDNDGRVEVAVGAQWNPGETVDESQSGSVHYLISPGKDEQSWRAIALPHEPTVHRMGWIKTEAGFQLVVVPLHGRGNQGGEGRGVCIYSYLPPKDPLAEWTRMLVDSTMHITHNFDIIEEDNGETLLIGGKEGAKSFRYLDGSWRRWDKSTPLIGEELGFGEIRKGRDFIAGVQPFHGNQLVVYDDAGRPQILTEELQQGHALACADLLGMGKDQIVVGWREKNADEELGIKLFLPQTNSWSKWEEFWIDKNGMACEDLKVADLNGDGKKDIIAAGRSTKNLKIYWNRN